MIVIFEGHDNSGKSSIAKAFAKLENGTYIQDDTLKDAVRENVNQTYARFQLALFLPCFDKSKLIVVDRAILSHLVYSTVFKHELKEHENCLIHQDKLCISYATRLIK